MSLSGCPWTPLVISSGTAISNTIANFNDAIGLTIYAPVTVTSTTVYVEVEPTSTGTNFVILQSGEVDVKVTTNRATVLSPPSFGQIRLHAIGNEPAERTFKVSKLFYT